MWMSGQTLVRFTVGVWDMANSWLGMDSSFALIFFSLCCSRPWHNEVLVIRARSLLDEKVVPRLFGCVIYDQREVDVSSLRAVGASACGYWCLRNWLKSSPSC